MNVSPLRSCGANAVRVCRLGLVALIVWFAAGTARAQELDPTRRPRMDTNVPAPPPPPAVQQQTKPLYVQSVVVAALMGGALWTVCRSSRRQ
jgi:hypothetical protein